MQTLGGLLTRTTPEEPGHLAAKPGAVLNWPRRGDIGAVVVEQLVLVAGVPGIPHLKARAASSKGSGATYPQCRASRPE